ncbi:hypothetical protein Pfo_008983 [Paulownia fortunei]|nr:hypothetical protein Pfo_008983 [Paulownia fortunei]
MFTMNGVENSRVFSMPEYSERVVLEMDQKSYGPSAEEVESRPPRSVAKMVVEKWKGRSYKVHAHSQILRIRAEDSHLGEDKIGAAHFMLFSRPILPASPLSGKTAH